MLTGLTVLVDVKHSGIKLMHAERHSWTPLAEEYDLSMDSRDISLDASYGSKLVEIFLNLKLRACVGRKGA